MNLRRKLSHCKIITLQRLIIMRFTPREERRDVESIVDDDDDVSTSSSSSSSYFWRSLVALDHRTPWWGWLRLWTIARAIYGRVATHGHSLSNFTTCSRVASNKPPAPSWSRRFRVRFFIFCRRLYRFRFRFFTQIHAILRIIILLISIKRLYYAAYGDISIFEFLQ